MEAEEGPIPIAGPAFCPQEWGNSRLSVSCEEITAFLILLEDFLNDERMVTVSLDLK